MEDRFSFAVRLALVLGCGLVAPSLPAQTLPLYLLGSDVTAAQRGTLAFGDVDLDGQQDLYVAGVTASGTPFVRLLRYSTLFQEAVGNGGTRLAVAFANVTPQELPGLTYPAAAWGDYDNDGDLDLAVSGTRRPAEPYEPVASLYANTRGAVPLQGFATFSGLYGGSIAWGDYDNDGDLDLLMTGTAAPEGPYQARLYRNDGVAFAGVEAGLEGKAFGAAVWADYDTDGDLDVLLTGASSPVDARSRPRLYRNDGDGAFTDSGVAFDGFLGGSAAWGDYDDDGDPDLLLGGMRLAPGSLVRGHTRLYRNDAGTFTDTGVPFAGAGYGGVAWGDLDLDGHLDALVGGMTELLTAAGTGEDLLDVYLGDGAGGFRLAARQPGAYFGALQPADFDADGDLDFIISGSGQGASAQITHNQSPLLNTPPSAPGAPASAVDGRSVVLSWEPAVDAQTPAPALTYNLLVGRTPEGVEVVSPMAIPGTGQRLVSAPGNVGHNTRWTLKNLPPGTYYWSVQALDHSYAGSVFTQRGMFTLP